MDLTGTAALKRLLDDIHAESRHVVVLTEGVVPYLTEADTGVLADALCGEPAIREWVIDYFSPFLKKYRQRMATRGGLQNAPFKFYPQDWHAFFREHGWQQREARFLGPEGNRLGRPIPLPWLSKIVIPLRLLFASATRRREMAQAAGYIVLERV
jgi:O-methyltransferase involved in polyketide biosynthesis